MLRMTCSIDDSSIMLWSGQACGAEGGCICMLQFMMKHEEGIDHGTAGALCKPFRVWS
jgi:hypothetical protein